METNKKTDVNNEPNQMNSNQTGQRSSPGAGSGQPAGNGPIKFNIFNVILITFLTVVPCEYF